MDNRHSDEFVGSPAICRVLLDQLMHIAGINNYELRKAVSRFVSDPLTGRDSDASARSQKISAIMRDLESPSLTIKKLAELAGVLGFDQFVLRIEAKRGGEIYEAAASHRPRTCELDEAYWAFVRGFDPRRNVHPGSTGDIHRSPTVDSPKLSGDDLPAD